jgi:exosortase C (VPDSG-CTERM-specific)
LVPDPQVGWRAAAIPLVAGIGLLTVYALRLRAGWHPLQVDYIALMTCAFLLLLVSSCLVLLGTGFLSRYIFAALFLVFIIPFPSFVERWIESFFQHGSAQVAYSFLWTSGIPILREGSFVFHLPSFSLAVAPECSGIHSSLVLFITSLLAGHLFLQRPTHRALLTIAVIPLAFVRNGFRIFTIAQLCVQVSPNMINHPIHRQGGPIFFALSLIPFFFVLYYLRKREIPTQPSLPLTKQLESVSKE